MNNTDYIKLEPKMMVPLRKPNRVVNQYCSTDPKSTRYELNEAIEKPALQKKLDELQIKKEELLDHLQQCEESSNIYDFIDPEVKVEQYPPHLRRAVKNFERKNIQLSSVRDLYEQRLSDINEQMELYQNKINKVSPKKEELNEDVNENNYYTKHINKKTEKINGRIKHKNEQRRRWLDNNDKKYNKFINDKSDVEVDHANYNEYKRVLNTNRFYNLYNNKKEFMQNRNRIYLEAKEKTEQKERYLLEKWKKISNTTVNGTTSLDNAYKKPTDYLKTQMPRLPDKPPKRLRPASCRIRPARYSHTGDYKAEIRSDEFDPETSRPKTVR